MFPPLINVHLPKAGHQLRLTLPSHGAQVLWLASLLQQRQERLIAVFCDSVSSLERWKHQLLGLIPNTAILTLPDWETLPYDHFSPHKDLSAERIRTLSALLQGQGQVVLISMASAMTRLSPKTFFGAHAFNLQTGNEINRPAFIQRLIEAGYEAVSQVMSAGEYAIRGGIIDLFAMGSQMPCRIELSENTIESLRLFDPDSQRTLYTIPALDLLPAREFPVEATSINLFRRAFREHYQGNYSAHPLYKRVSEGLPFAGAEYFLPWWVAHTATIFDYLPADALCWLEGNSWEEALTPFWQTVSEGYERHRHDPEWPVLPPNEVFVSPAQALQSLSSLARINVAINPQAPPDPAIRLSALPAIPTERERTLERPIQRLIHWQNQHPAPVILMAESAGRRNVWEEALAHLKIHYRSGNLNDCLQAIADTPANDCVWLTIADCDSGFISHAVGNFPAIVWIGEEDLLPGIGEKRLGKRESSGTHKIEQWIRDLSELQVGDCVVHEQYGIGRYLGLMHLESPEGDNEFLALEYANQQKLYVPVTQLQWIGRYPTSDDSAPIKLNTLGSGEWERAREKAQIAARDTAAELLSLYALRQAQTGIAIRPPKIALQLFAETFGFELTVDQQSAINAVLSDMAQETVMGIANIPMGGHNQAWANSPRKPMDRLVCGDVGFGKTEVALRAALVAVSRGFQVAILCPTTLLAEQHTQTFQDRFAQFHELLRKINLSPEMTDDEDDFFALQKLIDRKINIGGLSRFRSRAEQKMLLAELSQGKVDIVVGTHRLLQNDVRFAQLGLIIIDEEHRFGVRHKEALKQLRANAHILTLTATPIPRTLSLSMEGLRDFSVMTTPPSRRLSIKTMLGAFQDSLVREALAREFRRGGQVFFLHNEVVTISAMQQKLQALLPQARIAIAHGQMSEHTLERVMRDFRHQHFNVLLCTTIIENGIDIPNANTILIHRADRFGIAQLHQLRGRVGRSHHQAYCYLLVDQPQTLSKSAKQRMTAICESEELGAGFYLAMHDLEIRGAGELLGTAQSGAMANVGFDLYAKMLQNAVHSLKKGKAVEDQPFEHYEEINLFSSALLPNDYCADVHERLKIYKRLANAQEQAQIDGLRAEIIDRFGLLRDGHLPTAVETLLSVHRLRLRARPLAIKTINANADSLEIAFTPETPIEPMALIMLLRRHHHWSLKGNDKLFIPYPSTNVRARIDHLESVLNQLHQITDRPPSS